MVRFQWHVEDGFGAFIPPRGMVPHKDTKVQHAVVEIELAGQQLNVEALLTVPPGYLNDAEIKDVGIILAHGIDADEWRSKLLTEVAVALGKAGHVVMRYHCGQKEQRRQRIFEKVLDACATSPFARMCSRWVLAGIGNGARVAASVGTRCRGTLAGFVLMAYPLMEAMPTTKGAGVETSLLPLTKLSAPLLFVQPGHDPHCSAAMIRDNLDKMPASDIRMLELPETDGALKTVHPGGHHRGPLAGTIKRVANAVLDFVTALNDNRLDLCRVQQLKGEALAPGVTNLNDDRDSEEEGAAAPAQAAAAAASAPPGSHATHGSSVAQQVLQEVERRASGSAASTQAAAAAPGAPGPSSAAASAAGPAFRAGGLPAALLPALQGLLQGAGGAATLAALLGLSGAAGAGLPGNMALNLAAQQQLMAAAHAAMAMNSAAKRPAEADNSESAAKRANMGPPQQVLQLGGPLRLPSPAPGAAVGTAAVRPPG